MTEREYLDAAFDVQGSVNEMDQVFKLLATLSKKYEPGRIEEFLEMVSDK